MMPTNVVLCPDTCSMLAVGVLELLTGCKPDSCIPK
jgi:hypothetical protein